MRPVREIHQIEISSRCNLRCKYCPHPHLERPKQDMADDVWRASLDLVAHYCRAGTQGEVALTGMGEALLHPEVVRYVAELRETIGPHRPLTFATNGIELNDDLCALLKPHNPQIYVSLHRPEKAGPAIETAKRWGLYAGANKAFADSAYDWAGQVKWYNSGPTFPCAYLSRAWAVVLVDGAISTCCWDAHGKNIIGNVRDDPTTLAMRTFPLCDQCHHTVPDEYK